MRLFNRKEAESAKRASTAQFVNVLKGRRKGVPVKHPGYETEIYLTAPFGITIGMTRYSVPKIVTNVERKALCERERGKEKEKEKEDQVVPEQDREREKKRKRKRQGVALMTVSTRLLNRYILVTNRANHLKRMSHLLCSCFSLSFV